jgi:hypothetical protein
MVLSSIKAMPSFHQLFMYLKRHGTTPPYGAVTAANRAVDHILDELVLFLRETMNDSSC